MSVGESAKPSVTTFPAAFPAGPERDPTARDETPVLDTFDAAGFTDCDFDALDATGFVGNFRVAWPAALAVVFEFGAAGAFRVADAAGLAVAFAAGCRFADEAGDRAAVPDPCAGFFTATALPFRTVGFEGAAAATADSSMTTTRTTTDKNHRTQLANTTPIYQN